MKVYTVVGVVGALASIWMYGFDLIQMGNGAITFMLVLFILERSIYVPIVKKRRLAKLQQRKAEAESKSELS